ncbi:MAG: hypothetical protein M3547_13790, partial [Acidobacteriota bacterium]|nr:hypothetical protein [Acidobacteriota bacterium]
MSFKGGLFRSSCAALLLAGVALVPLRGASAAAFGSLSALIGSSGKLKAVFSLPGDKETQSVAGAAGNPGVYPLSAGDAVTANLSLIVMKPFSAKVNGRIGTYRMGTWPNEKGTPKSASYAPPKGFVEVTRETFGTHVSDHFTVGEFVTKDQRDVWP